MSIPPSFFDIQYFLEVSDTCNISRASERLGITQPSLSAAIKRLEDSLGTQLLVRSRTGVVLTKAGQELVSQGRLLLQQWQQLQMEVGRQDKEITGRYIIGCHPSVALNTLSKFLPSLLMENPELEIELVHDMSRKITEKVISFAIDFGIVVNPVAHPDLVIKELCRDNVCFWSANKPSKNQRLESSQKVLICDPHLLQTQKLLSDLQKKKIMFKRIIESTSLEVISDLTSHGVGIGILPTRVAQHFSSKQLKKVSESLPSFKDKICLVYRADKQKTMARTLIQKLIQEKITE